MKLNQFALRPTTFEEEVIELQRIRFLPKDFSQWSSTFSLSYLLKRSFPETTEDSSLQAKLEALFATPTDNIVDYLQQNLVTAKVFYNVYFQLLGFIPEVDFPLNDPLRITSQVNYPQFTHSHLSPAEIISGWYQLLITHTVNGQTFLDELTNRGYFQEQMTSSTTPRPLFFNGKAQAVFDTHRLIREVVYVESPQDSDHDGQRDLLKVNIIRPVESNQQPVPVLYTASPYDQGTNDYEGEQLTHNINTSLTVKAPQANTLHQTSQSTSLNLPPARDAQNNTRQTVESFNSHYDYSLNNYFLARGFAVIYAAGIGTKDSQGWRTCGDQQETISTVAIIEWLTGQRTAFTTTGAQKAITAWWCNQKVAMTGRSYLGTLAIAAATTGISGLKTIISEAAISSWYDYYREHGLVVAPEGFPGEDADVLAEETFSRQKNAKDYLTIKNAWHNQLQQLGKGQERSSGNYTDFWEQRNYRHQLQQITADIIMVHGLNDWNVKPKNVYKFWHALQPLPVKQKLILHQGPHIYINDFRSLDFTDMMNLWLSYKLYDLDNQADQILPDVLIQDNAQPETWSTQSDWPQTTDSICTYQFQPQTLTKQSTPKSSIMQYNDQLPAPLFKYYTQHLQQWEHDLMSVQAEPLKSHRLIFQTPPLNQPLLIEGRPEIRLKIASSQNLGLVSVRLVDYGNFRRLSALPTTLATQASDLGYQYQKVDLREYLLQKKPTAYQLISLGHLNLQNRTRLTQVQSVVAQQYYSLVWQLQPTHYRLLAGHQLGLIVYSTDFQMTIRGNQAITYNLDLKGCQLKLNVNPDSLR